MSGRGDHEDSRREISTGRREFAAAAGTALLAAATGATALGRRPPPISAGDPREAQRYERERKYAHTRYGRIAYVERGQGPAVLLLHGFPLNAFQWRGVIPRLCAQRRCVAPDFMGLGFSEVPKEQGVSLGAQADMLAAFLDGRGIRHVDIIANDSGGAVAQLFIARHAARARSLLLTNCDVETDSPPESVLPIIELARRGQYTEQYLRPWLKDKGGLRASAAFGRLCYSDPRHPTDAAIDQYLGPLVSSAERSALTNRFAASLAPNPLAGITASLRSCAVPTRIVWGMKDRIFSPGNIEYLVSVLPRVTGIRRIEDAKLFFPEERPEVIAEEARALWKEAAQAAA
jgi:haloalkane dehalogenase